MLLSIGRVAALLMAAHQVTVAGDAAALRPFDGTDASVAAEGTIDLEIGPVDWIGASDADVLAPSVNVSVGVAHGWEVSAFGQPSWLVSGRDGNRFDVADASLVLKRVLREGGLQGRTGPSVAIEASGLLPVIAPLDRFGARVTPVVSQTWSGFTGHLSASAYWTRLDEPAVLGSLILEGPEIGARIRPALEATTGWERHSGRSWSGLVALLWNPRDDLAFDLGFELSRAFDTTTREIRAGFTWSLRAWDSR